MLVAFPLVLSADHGSSSFVFLRVGAGSRPVALSEAVTASATDVTTAFYNPAALVSFDGNNQIAFMYNSYFKDVSFGFLAAGFKLKKNRAIGLYVASGKVANIERRGDIPSLEPMGNFDENNLFAAVLFAQKINRFSLGLAFKYAYEKIDFGSANAFMIDLGGQASLSDEITAGLAFKHIGTKPKFIDKSYQLPREYRMGLSYKPGTFKNRLECLAEGILFNDSRPKYNFGLEYGDNRIYALRIGYGVLYDSRGFTLGGGLIYRQFKFDYAFVPYKHDLGNAHRFTLTATF